jgi:D-alanine-D-alanine ligase-like ATP-grasp enzyme
LEDAIVKSLSSAQVSDEKVMYTTRVDTSQLAFAGNPWLIQEYVRAEADVTVQIVGSTLHTFERIRTEKTVDWRKEQLDDIGKSVWKVLPLTRHQEHAIRDFIAVIQVEWGRIDLLRTSEGELVFLEFNANGQFAFLDIDDRHGLITSVAKYLSSWQHPKAFVNTKEKEKK